MHSASNYIAALSMALIIGLFTSCASTPDDNTNEPQGAQQQAPAKTKARTKAQAKSAPKNLPQPQPQTIRLSQEYEIVDSENPQESVEKSLFNIAVSPKNIIVNGVPVSDLNALQKLLAQYDKPVLTISGHRCLDADKAVEIVNIAQNHTDTPIPYGSFGDYDDEECK